MAIMHLFTLNLDNFTIKQYDIGIYIVYLHPIADFDDADSASSSDMDEYGSEDELPDMPPCRDTGKGPKLPNPQAGNYLGLQDYMDLMDKELANTAIGASFEKESVSKSICYTVYFVRKLFSVFV